MRRPTTARATARATARRHRLLVGLGVLAAAALAACGGDDAGSSGSGCDDVEGLCFEAREMSFTPETTTVGAGEVEITLVNEGAVVHTLVFEDGPDVELEVATNGDVDTARADLEPGTYVFYCDVPGHRAAGMEGTLVVE